VTLARRVLRTFFVLWGDLGSALTVFLTLVVGAGLLTHD
jgi:hypothetical protein